MPLLVPGNAQQDVKELRARLSSRLCHGSGTSFGLGRYAPVTTRFFARPRTEAEEVPVGLLDGMLGNASEIDVGKIQAEFSQILAEGERVEKAYQLIRDFFVFTDKRLVLVNKQGLTGSKIEYHSIPYRSVIHFSVETAGHFDLDAELKIWVSGRAEPFQKQFNKKLSIYEVQAVLTKYVLR